MKVEMKMKMSYNFINVDENVANIILSIAMNADKEKLNKFFESLGAIPDMISEEVFKDFQKLGRMMIDSRKFKV